MCSLFVLCLFSVLDGVSQSLEIGSDQFIGSLELRDVCVVCEGFPWIPMDSHGFPWIPEA